MTIDTTTAIDTTLVAELLGEAAAAVEEATASAMELQKEATAAATKEARDAASRASEVAFAAAQAAQAAADAARMILSAPYWEGQEEAFYVVVGAAEKAAQAAAIAESNWQAKYGREWSPPSH